MKAYWMWHWGEYEIYHTNIMSDRRQEFGADYPTSWHCDNVYPVIEFFREISTERDTTLTLYVCGKGYITVDGKRYPDKKKIAMAAGKHFITVRVSNFSGLPAAFIESELCPSGEGWTCTRMTPIKSPAAYLPYYDSPDITPDTFPFSYETKHPVSTEKTENEKGRAGILYDFGKEMYGFIDISGLDKSREYGIFYGESSEEALADEEALIFEYIKGSESVRLRQRAFRYIFITDTGDLRIRVSAEYEYLPLTQKGSFRCDNETINRVWEMCRYTFELNCRETYLDGIKRDRWPWSGDAYQSYDINRYLYADKDIDSRTIIGLRGKDPVEQHINTIIDYSMYWIIALTDYYMTYGDKDFLKMIYPRTLSLYEFIRTRENEDGFIQAKDGDWTFIDWSDIDKTGAVCAEQMLYIRTKTAMAEIAEIIGEDTKNYRREAKELLGRVNDFYWDKEKGAYIDSYSSGKRNVTRHANIFALLFDIADSAQRESIIKNVLLSDSIQKITTPYFEGYELDAMCSIGNFSFFENMLTSYWGKMLELGATTVWEAFDPTQNGAEHYAMYGNRFAKSLCHAWGSTPIYLLGRYYLGVYPTTPGYREFNVEPYLGGFGEIEGTAPAGKGSVYVHLTKASLTAKSDVEGGTLIWQGRKYPLKANEEIHFDL